MDGIFSALEAQGLRLRQVECEQAKGFALPFVQEFEFVPTTGHFKVAGVKLKSWLIVILKPYSSGLRSIVINEAHPACWPAC